MFLRFVCLLAGVAVAMETAEAELAAGCEELRRLASADPSNASPEALLALLQRLLPMPIDAGMLRRTGIGKEVNQKWIRSHRDESVQKACNDLVETWKAAVLPP